MISIRSWRVRLTVLVIVILAVYLSFYIWILQSVKETVTSIYMDGKNGIQLDESRVSDPVKNKFLQFIDFPNREEDDEIRFKLSMGHVFHTFVRGKVWVEYTYKGVDQDTKQVKYGASKVPIQIKAKLDQWEWVIVDKKEKP
ncbi:hypothetical protein SAMN05216378_0347 [Paenibacillus catalpae]|uniref:Uncharacterized protein n=1 Tax=Paenibacillus catalpae TaxID=1045775 RepID=A0A1I1TAN3_9BACL|nr:hypothetical protein [Paenibacillus catalpae]SFD53363.1 hypothetical protein SAMN05216378_0347 [Paenibacillus catalpae]